MNRYIPVIISALLLAGCVTDNSLEARVKAMHDDPAALTAALLTMYDPSLVEVLDSFRPNDRVGCR